MSQDFSPFTVKHCLLWCFVAVKGHHEQGTSYKGKRLTGADLPLQMFGPLSSWQEAWQHAGRHGAGGAESYS